MIAELDRFLKTLLLDKLGYPAGEIEVQFHQPAREWSGRLSGQATINLFLFDVRENNTLRQHEWQRLPATQSNLVQQQRTPYRIDCHYLLTTWVNDPEDAHRLLGECLLALLGTPLVKTEDLAETPLAGQPYDLPIRVAAHDKMTNPAEVWSALDNELRPSISLIVTIAMNPWDSVPAQQVRLRRMRLLVNKND